MFASPQYLSMGGHAPVYAYFEELLRIYAMDFKFVT